MSEVHYDTPKKKNELTTIFNLLKQGKSKKDIKKLLKLSPSNFANYLGKLEELGVIKREGKWKVNILSSSLNHPKVTLIPINKILNKRGHAHNFKVIFPSEENLKDKPSVKEFLNRKPRKGKRFKRVPVVLPFGSVKFTFKRYTIWINKKTLTIYSNMSYYSQDALHSKFRALQDVDNLVQQLKAKFGFKGGYGIEVFREHYGLIFNKFAGWLLARKRKLNVKTKGNKTILWVDDSMEDDIGLKEFEGISPNSINNADEKFFEEHEKTGWKVTPEFTMNGLNLLRENQEKQALQISQFAEALNKHIPAYEKMGNTAELLMNEIKSLKEEIANLKNGSRS